MLRNEQTDISLILLLLGNNVYFMRILYDGFLENVHLFFYISYIEHEEAIFCQKFCQQRALWHNTPLHVNYVHEQYVHPSLPTTSLTLVYGLQTYLS